MYRQRKHVKKKGRRPFPQNHSIDTFHQTNKLGDYNNCNLDDSLVCANCCSPIHNSSQQQSSTFSKNASVRAVKDSDVNKMLSSIYNLELIPPLLQKYSDTLSEDVQVQVVVDFPLCFICTTLLKSLFSMYTQFNELRKIESLLSRQINSLNLLVNYNDSNPNDEVSATCDSSSSSKVKSKFNSNDPEPCVSVEIEPLENLTVEDIGYAPPSLRHLYQNELEETSNHGTIIISSCHSNAKKLKSSLADRGTWVKVGPRLKKDVTFEANEEIENDPLALTLCHPEASEGNLVISNVFSIAPGQCDEDDADHDMDYKPSLLPFNDDEVDNEFSPQQEPDLSENEDVKPLPTLLDLGHGSESSEYLTHRANTEKRKEATKNSNEQVKESRRKQTLQFLIEEAELTENESDCQSKIKPRKIVRRTRGEKIFMCTAVINEAGQVCSFRTKHSGNFSAHMLSVHGEEKDTVRCDDCDRVFKHKIALRRHLKTMHTEKERNPEKKVQQFSCPAVINEETGQVCPFRTQHQGNLKTHLLNVHAEDKNRFQCGECGKRFKSTFSLKQHVVYMHTEKGRELHEKKKAYYAKASEKKISCTVILEETGQVCPFKAVVPSLLKKHMICVHSQDKYKVKCKQCSKIFKSSYHLKFHIQRMHSGRKKSTNFTRAGEFPEIADDQRESPDCKLLPPHQYLH